jgi:hypothetical protein
MGLREDMEEAVTSLQSGGDGGQRMDSALDGEKHDFRAPLDQAREETPAPTPESEKPARPRDQSGKFAPRTAAKTPAEQGQQQPALTGQGQAAEGQEQPTDGKPAPTPAPGPQTAAPPSWSPEEKAVWGTIDPRAQKAILRRDREVNVVLQQTGEIRRFASEFQRVITPYMPMIQAEGSDPLRSISYLLDTAAKLRTAPAPQRAELVADMIMQFGVDMTALDGALVQRLNNGGRPATPPDTRIIEQVRQEIKPLSDFVQRQQSSQQQVLEQQALEEWNTFVADPKNTYAEEVSEEMADLMLAYANMNKTLSLQDAYKLATMRHPRISQELSQRTEPDVTQLSQAARRARDASASLPSSGAPLQSGEESSDGSLMGDIVSSIRQLSTARR